ncbi:MAG: TlyA family RNA methyltransferase [Sphaerochaetaceae bacterium]
MKKHQKKMKAVQLLMEQFPLYSRSELLSIIAAKQAKIGGEGVSDPNQLFSSDSEGQINIPKYVSRGGLKLESALEGWNIDVRGMTFIDAGSSTGGFTDCLLQHGAEKVYSVDVGYNQLDYRLRVHPDVIVYEKKNIMHLTEEDVSADAAVADLSFRSISHAASHILNLTAQQWMISLIKPQFEIDPSIGTFNGVIRDRDVLFDTLCSVQKNLREENVHIQRIKLSPIHGRKGNREFLALLSFEEGMDSDSFSKEVSALLDGEDFSFDHNNNIIQ